MDTVKSPLPPPTLDPLSRDSMLAAAEAKREADVAPTAAPSVERLSFENVFAGIAPRDPAEIAAWQWKNETLPRLKAAGLHERHSQRLTDWREPKQRAVFEKVRGLCSGTGAIVALIGPRGTGKTTIGAQLIIERAQNEALPPWERQPPYRKLVDVIARYKPLYADFGSTSIDELMAARDHLCSSYSLLVLDELHECDDQKLKDRVLTDILDRRYAARRDTVLISNQTAAVFNETTSDSVRSRVTEHGMIIQCQWPSWRATNRAA